MKSICMHTNKCVLCCYIKTHIRVEEVYIVVYIMDIYVLTLFGWYEVVLTLFGAFFIVMPLLKLLSVRCNHIARIADLSGLKGCSLTLNVAGNPMGSAWEKGARDEAISVLPNVKFILE